MPDRGVYTRKEKNKEKEAVNDAGVDHMVVARVEKKKNIQTKQHVLDKQHTCENNNIYIYIYMKIYKYIHWKYTREYIYVYVYLHVYIYINIRMKYTRECTWYMRAHPPARVDKSLMRHVVTSNVYVSGQKEQGKKF
jgi:hypothetical protein